MNGKWITCATVIVVFVFLLLGCDLCGCDRGTLKLRGSNGDYTAVCEGSLLKTESVLKFKCDDGRTIMNPVNFILDRKADELSSTER